MKQPKSKVITEDYFECKLCNISSETKGRMCPCPRGGCEAEIVGKKLTITRIILD
jgi:hypothetical protein